MKRQQGSTRRKMARWQRIYGFGKGADRAYSARVDRVKERGQYTPPKGVAA